MEEVHASNSLSSSKLAAPAQKDLGAVNNSVWLRDFHFSGPGLPLPQGPARGWLLAAPPCSSPLAPQLLPGSPSPILPASPSAPCLCLSSPSPCSLSWSPPPSPRCPSHAAHQARFSLCLPHPLARLRQRQSHCALQDGWTGMDTACTACACSGAAADGFCCQQFSPSSLLQLLSITAGYLWALHSLCCAQQHRESWSCWGGKGWFCPAQAGGDTLAVRDIW